MSIVPPASAQEVSGPARTARAHASPVFTSTPITGADNFQLLLDRHMRRHGQAGNAVRAELHLPAGVDADELAERLRTDPLPAMLCRLRVLRRPGRPARWVLADPTPGRSLVTAHAHMDERMFNDEILNRSMDLKGHAVHVDLVPKADGGLRVVFSAHHALVDRRGMLNLVQAMDPAGPGWAGPLFAAPERGSFGRLFADSARTTVHMLSRPFWRLARLGPKNADPKNPAVFHTLHLDGALVDRAAASHHGVLHRSAFHLAATFVALRAVHEERGQRPPYFWVSRPMSRRPRGHRGHLIGNAITFQYARVGWADARDLRRCTEVIAAQFKRQLVDGVTERYTSLLTIFTRLPLVYYSAMIDLAMGGHYASCAFSDLGEDPFEPRTFAGKPIEAFIDHPSVPCPPGITVVFSRRGDQVQVTIGAVPESLCGVELDRFEQVLRQALTHVPAWDGEPS